MWGLSGRLVLVVGPSGAGKDSIIRHAQKIFAGDTGIVFPRRVVTRKADVQAEDHDSTTEMAFALAVANGDYAIWWHAHGNGYGIPVAIIDDLRMGRTVIFNCSRAVIGEVQKEFANVIVADIKVAPHVLVDRIVARGRENREEAFIRVSRTVPPFPTGSNVFSIQNNGALENAAQAFCDFVRSLNDALPDPRRGALNDQHEYEDGDDGGRRLVVVK